MSVLKDLAPLIITFVVAALAILFRHEVRKVIDWVVGFRQITKTKDGYSLVGSTDADRKTSEQQTRTDVAAVAIPSPTVSATTPQIDAIGGNWIESLGERRFDDALSQLKIEYEQAQNADDR